MKKIFLLLIALLPSLTAVSRPMGKAVSTAAYAVISEFDRCNGVEVIRMGPFAMTIARCVLNMSSDPDSRQALELVKGIRRISVFSYEDCAPALQNRISRRVNDVLGDYEPLMEVRDGEDTVRMFGSVDENTGDISDFVLHISDGMIVCFSGRLPMEAVSRLIAEAE